MKNKYKLLALTLIYTILTHHVLADTIDSNGTHWPIPQWEMAKDIGKNMSSRQCRDFINFSTKSKSFLTDGLVVVKDGLIQYESYDSQYNRDRVHPLWSISKTITGALLGIAVGQGKISLDQHLAEFLPRPGSSPQYQDIKIKNLFYLDTGFIWNEFYSGDLRSSPVVNMLYGVGRNNILEHALNHKILPAGPGHQRNYTTGTPAITMGVLKKIYGPEYDSFPWKSFFNPLGMNNAVFERDQQGIYNGGSYAFATPRDMAKIGYLYLNNGSWNGQEILSKDWVDKTLQVSPGYLTNETIIRDITSEGVYGGSIWLNRAAKKGFGKPYPSLPENMYLARGHYGQLIIVLPSEKMVIARTAYDKEYNSKIDEFTSRALSCFVDPKHPIGKIILPPKEGGNSFFDTLKTIKSGLETNIIQTAVAKSVCSCHFVVGLDIETCLERSNIPAATLLTKISSEKNKIYTEQTRLASFLAIFLAHEPARKIEAHFNADHPEFGCTLM